MMSAMMKQCCDEDGKPDLEKMMQFMKHCGKEAFSENEIEMIKRFCVQARMPNEEMMKEMMEHCGCHLSGRTT
jgi:hypothetical protein